MQPFSKMSLRERAIGNKRPWLGAASERPKLSRLPLELF
jgi:hypothetical protein